MLPAIIAIRPGPKVQSLKNKAANLHQELFLSDASKPKYGQIQDSILANIKKGLWAPGDRVPPERKLAEIFRDSPGPLTSNFSTHGASHEF
jgi:hypothetical protein